MPRRYISLLPCRTRTGGTYTGINGSAECSNCLTRLSSYEGSTSCDVCAEGFFRLDAQTVATPNNCDDSLCTDPGVYCPHDTTLETILLRPGFWRVSNRSREISACSGGNVTARCKGGNGVAPPLQRRRLRRRSLLTAVASSTEDGDVYCGELFIGPE